MSAVLFFLTLSAHFLLPSYAASDIGNIWGTYRPHALLSVRARVPNSPIFGFTYHSLHDPNIRHLTSDHPDSIRKFSWNRHDGRDGEQTVEDAELNLNITTHFVHHPNKHAWVLRFAAEPLNPALPSYPISVVYYAGTGPEHSVSARDHWTTFQFAKQRQDGVVINGKDKAVGSFRVHVRNPLQGAVESVSRRQKTDVTDASRTRRRIRADADFAALGNLNRFFTSGRRARPEVAWMVESLLMRSYQQQLQTMELGTEDDDPVLLLDDTEHPAAAATFVQRILKAPFSIDTTFISTQELSEKDVESVSRDLRPAHISSMIRQKENIFNARFEEVFGLSAKGIPAEEIQFAKVALSNVLGGLGYFHGSSIAKADRENPSSARGAAFLDPVSLFTATPSRSSFPRGFLWDEGFHQLIVQRWDEKISEDCLRSWLSAMQNSGWIPREQVLGIEAQRRFPQHVQHLLVQRPDIANPPTLIMPLRVLAALKRIASSSANHSDEPACEASMDDSSAGVCRSSDRKRNTSATGAAGSSEFLEFAMEKLTVYFDWLRKTQAGEEKDTFRWRGRSLEEKSQGIYPLTLASGLDDYPRSNTPNLDERHIDLHAWMTWAAGALAEMAHATGKNASRFEDLAVRWKSTLTEKYKYSPSSKSNSGATRNVPLLCDQDGLDSVCHEGYVTILPFVLGLLDPDDELVGSSLDALEREDILFSPAGVRSLSAADEMYQKGDNYWTGRVWMSFNYLTLAALRTKYSVEDGPYRERSEKLFHRLKSAVLSNAFNVYKETGFLWENYSPVDGSGKSGRQFTGWSSLILLIYADMYQGVVI